MKTDQPATSIRSCIEQLKSNILRNVYTALIAIVFLLVIFNRAGIERLFQRDVPKSSIPRLAVQPDPPQAHSAETEMPLNSKDAGLACGKVMNLDASAIERLELRRRLSTVVANSFTQEEIKKFAKNPLEDASSAYMLGYVTWDKSKDSLRTSLDKLLMDSVHTVDQRKLSSEGKIEFEATMAKLQRMILEASDLGRHDARISPCMF
jgi:hypothetical protein